MNESPGVLLRRSMSSEAGVEREGEGPSISVMSKKALPFVMKSGEEEIDQAGIGELPDLVDHAVLVGDRKIGDGEVGWVFVRIIAAAAEDQFFGGEGGVGVEHVDLLAVGAGGLEKGEAVGFVLGE